MTFREILEKLFSQGDLDKEVDLTTVEPAVKETKEQTKVEVDNDGKSNNQQKKEPVKDTGEVEPTKKEEEIVSIFDIGWLDEKTGKIDYNKVKNEEVKAALQVLDGRYTSERQQRDIGDAINSELSKYKLTVSSDAVKKMLDTSGIKFGDDGKVVGVKESIEALKKQESGLFIEKGKESSPLNEGFSPVQKTSIDNIASLQQAIELTNEMNG